MHLHHSKIKWNSLINKIIIKFHDVLIISIDKSVLRFMVRRKFSNNNSNSVTQYSDHKNVDKTNYSYFKIYEIVPPNNKRIILIFLSNQLILSKIQPTLIQYLICQKLIVIINHISLNVRAKNKMRIKNERKIQSTFIQFISLQELKIRNVKIMIEFLKHWYSK